MNLALPLRALPLRAALLAASAACAALSPAIAQKYQADGQRFLALERERTARIAQSGGSVVRRYY